MSVKTITALFMSIEILKNIEYSPTMLSLFHRLVINIFEFRFLKFLSIPTKIPGT